MNDTRPILYGVADYAALRKANAWFVDRTAKIRDLEATRYALFLRPRRFGKSLLLSMLQYYYDVAFADRFEELFGGTDIGANPTDEHGRYLVLYFDFSGISKETDKVQDDFDFYVSLRCDSFARDYRGILPEGLPERILSAPDSRKKMNVIVSGLRSGADKLYVLIDEYDNFTNTILAESGLDAYNDLCHGDGFFKQFFTILKTATGGVNAPVTRLFVTGVSPVTMDDVTSGFNIGTNISLDPQFADFTGFRHDDLRAIADYYASRCGFDADRAYQTALTWYDNYRFGDFGAPSLANTTLVLNFFGHLWRTGRFPGDLVDKNLRTDYAKVRHLITVNNRLNGNFHALETLVSKGSITEQLIDSFQARDIAKRENFVSLLYWFGITTIAGDDMGTPVFGIPNGALRQICAQMFTEAYSDACGIDQRLSAVNAGLRAFASTGTWDTLLEPLLDVVRQNFAVRDAKEGETAVASAVSAILISAGGPYIIKREREANGGFYDLSLSPRFDIAPKIAHAALVEMKYVKAGDPAPTPEALARIKAEAVEQLDQYAASRDLAAEWRLNPVQSSKFEVQSSAAETVKPSNRQTAETVKPSNCQTVKPTGGTVTLHRLVLVFHGGECVLAEEA